MDTLEGSTLELIHRRRVQPLPPGYAVIFMVVGMVVALPLVKVDIVSTSAGMIRPVVEPTEILSPMAGIVDSTRLTDHTRVEAGDTLLWLRRDIPFSRMIEISELVRENNTLIGDIIRILDGDQPGASARYIQTHRNHIAAAKRLELKRDYLFEEFTTMETLFRQEVISLSAFEQARSDYRLACAETNSLKEQYRSSMEDELQRLRKENQAYSAERIRTEALLKDHVVLAPASGLLMHCRVISRGSVLPAGIPLARISPTGRLVAECYVDPREISSIRKGTVVSLTFPKRGYRNGYRTDCRITEIDPDVVTLNGRSVYRIRCLMPETTPVIAGMTFSASLVLDRSSLASLFLEKLNRWGNPALAGATTVPADGYER